MTHTVLTGLDRLLTDETIQKKYLNKKCAYLCHSASVDQSLTHGLIPLKKIFKENLVAVFGPQHGFVTDVQDNMVESKHYIHPYFNLKVFSLYSETRSPTPEMLKDLEVIFVDLQDVGTRIYTYIYTLTLLMESAIKHKIKVVVLDRPNPINGETIEGNILDLNYASFVGRHPIPVRHALTMGEVAMMHKWYWGGSECDLEIIPMKGWKRWMSFEDTKLPWVMPSPNLPTIEAAYTFVGTVLYEGTNISEGRGTTRSLEIVGHPKIEPFSFHDHLKKVFLENNLKGFVLRPLVFQPTFQKHQGESCGGFQIHVTDRSQFEPWRLCQYLCREFYHHLGSDFKWKQPPYEYEYHKMPIDLINGTDLLRLWVEKNGNDQELKEIEKIGLADFIKQRKEILIYDSH